MVKGTTNQAFYKQWLAAIIQNIDSQWHAQIKHWRGKMYEQSLSKCGVKSGKIFSFSKPTSKNKFFSNFFSLENVILFFHTFKTSVGTLHLVLGLRPSSVITIREEHIAQHSYSTWRLGIQYSEKENICYRQKSKEQTNGVGWINSQNKL